MNQVVDLRHKLDLQHIYVLLKTSMELKLPQPGKMATCID